MLRQAFIMTTNFIFLINLIYQFCSTLVTQSEKRMPIELSQLYAYIPYALQ